MAYHPSNADYSPHASRTSNGGGHGGHHSFEGGGASMMFVEGELPPLPEPVVDLEMGAIEQSTAKKDWVKAHMEKHIEGIVESQSYVAKAVKEHQHSVRRNKYLIGYGHRTINARAHAQKSIDIDNEMLLQRLCNLPKTGLSKLLDNGSRDNERAQNRKRNRILAKLAVRKVELESINFENSVRGREGGGGLWARCDR